VSAADLGAVLAAAVPMLAWWRRRPTHKTVPDRPDRQLDWQAVVELALDRDIVVMLDEAGCVTYVSPAITAVLGYPQSAVVGQSVFDLVHPTDLPRAKQAFAEGLEQTGSAPPRELRVRHADGSWREVEVLGNNRLADPAFGCIMLAVRDITERPRSAEELRRVWSQTQQYLDLAEVIFVGLDRQGKVALVNRKGLGLLGYERESAIVGKPWFETCLPQDEVETVRSVFEAAMSGDGGLPEYYENAILTRSGARRLIAWHNVVLRHSNGVPMGTLSSGEDITERRGAEQALKESQDRFRAVFEGAGIGVTIVDPENMFVSCNEAIERFLGYSRDELFAMTLADVSHPKDYAEVLELKRRMIETGQPVGVLENRYLRKDGSLVWGRLTLSLLLDEQGNLQFVVAMVEDITRRRQSEAKMRLSDSILQSVGNLVVVADDTGEIRYVSPSVRRILGLDPHECLEDGWWRLTVSDPQEREREQTLVASKAAGREPLGDRPYERVVVDVRGQQRRLEWTDSQGPYNLLIRVAHDVTERKAAEEALREREDRFRAVAESAVDSILVADAQGRIVFCNHAAEQVFGYSRAEMHLLPIAKLIPDPSSKPTESDPEAPEQPVAPMDLSGSIIEAVGRRRDGSTLPVEISVGSWEVQGQQFFSWVIRDITERKKAEAALKQSASSLRALIDHALYGIYRSSPEGRFLAANPALVEMLGYDDEAEVLKLDLAKEVYARAAERARLVKEFSGADRIDGVEATWRRKDGSLFAVRLSGRPVHDTNGRAQYFEMVAEDITERRALESQLRHAQKMEAVGQLTAGIAHDFNNILTAILANTELLQESLPPEQTEVLQDVDEIGKAARRATDMIKQLMTFGRREQLDRSPLDLSQFVRQVSTMLRRLLPENIEIRLETGNAGFAHANPSAMEQILLNLATNARDAMPAGGVLRIETRHAALDEQYRTTHGWGVPGEYECLSVSDTGTGMDARTRERIFEPFFTTKPQGQGTGLGLAMVYGLVKQHAGYINVYSEPALGTTFRIYVPTSTEEQVLPEPAVSEDMPTGTETILVVEDEAAIRRSVQRILERQGYRVLTAENGQQAMEFLRDHGPSLDLVITDLVMPKLSGMQLFEAAQTRGYAVKFLFTSGYSEVDVSKARPEGRDVPFLRKPWTVAELLGKVREAIDQPLGSAEGRA